MLNNKKVTYMVKYVDDNKKKHITFVRSFSEVKFLEDRFCRVSYEILKQLQQSKYNIQICL